MDGKDGTSGSRPRFDPARVSRAIALAATLHQNQRDKGGAPYILHPLHLMFEMQGGGEDAMIAAVLHDAVEDCGLPLHDVAMQFGDVVAESVDALTRRDGEHYKDFIERCGQNDVARQVKMRDLSHNSDLSRLKKIGPEDLARIQKYSAAYDRLAALATEARSAETPQDGSVHEGAGRDSDNAQGDSDVQ